MNAIEAPAGCGYCAEVIADIYANFRDNDWPAALQDEIAASAALGVIHGHHGIKVDS